MKHYKAKCEIKFHHGLTYTVQLRIQPGQVFTVLDKDGILIVVDDLEYGIQREEFVARVIFGENVGWICGFFHMLDVEKLVAEEE